MSRALPPSVPKRMPSDQFEQMTNDFRFKGMLAVAKVARSDLLVALHLSLDLIRDCCVLAMQLRDWETGTDHHRTGDAANRPDSRSRDTTGDGTPRADRH
jgi:hypothetical protein